MEFAEGSLHNELDLKMSTLCKLSWWVCIKVFKEIFIGTHQRIINLHLDRIALFVYTLCKF